MRHIRAYCDNQENLVKKHKKDPTHRLHAKGYQAAIAGRNQSACPYQEGTNASFYWLSGWREGRQDQWSGYNEMTMQQKVSNM